jgi:uncharacterized membrane protein
MTDEPSTGKTVSDILQVLSWLVLIVGGVAGAAALFAGFDVQEPWSANGYPVTDEWMSIGLGFLSAALIAVYTAVVWALIQAVRLVVRYVTNNGAGTPIA